MTFGDQPSQVEHSLSTFNSSMAEGDLDQGISQVPAPQQNSNEPVTLLTKLAKKAECDTGGRLGDSFRLERKRSFLLNKRRAFLETGTTSTTSDNEL